VVCPLVGDSAKVEAKSATEEFERLSAGPLSGLRVGLLHGQMAPAAREEVMAQFRVGEVEVLVATTVIEVGVDVPEATVMVIESADRFGIAQLHQLRGRVGRSALPSWCYLLGGGGSADDADEGAGVASERLAAVARTTDGFALAEDDLRLRGEGTLLGARQKGHTDLRLASLSDPDDRALLTEARRVAEAIVSEDPLLGAHAALEDEIRLFLSEDEGEYLFKS
jgi:ATP-dependent DNA helicase RecG